MISDEDLDNRFSYHPPREQYGDVTAHQRIRSTGKTWAALIINLTPPSREQSLAITAIEEAVMWANAARARHPMPDRNDVTQPR